MNTLKNGVIRPILVFIIAVAFSLTAKAQTLEISEYTVDFGAIDTAQTELTHTIYLKNTGSSPLTIDSITNPQTLFGLSGAPANNTTISVQDSISLDVLCRRDSTPGLYQSSFEVFSNDIDTTVATQIQLSWAKSAFTFDDITFWIGNGSNVAMLVVDFNDTSSTESYAWGYRFDGNISADSMLAEIAAADTNLNINTGGGFLNTIEYKTHSGIGGSPNYWGTWSGTGLHDWMMNAGLSTTISDSAWFGCSYTDFMPALIPELPVAADDVTTQIASSQYKNLAVYPNPVRNKMTVNLPSEIKNSRIVIYNLQGQMVKTKQMNGNATVSLTNLYPGMYIVKVITDQQLYSTKIQKL